MNLITTRWKQNSTNINLIYNDIKNYLIPGCIFLTSTSSNLGYYLSPSPLKHCAIFFGKNLKKYLIELKNDIFLFIILEQKNIFKSRKNKLNYNNVYYLKEEKKYYNINNIILNIDYYINSVNNFNEYVLEMNEGGFKILEIFDYIKNKDILYLLYYIGNENKENKEIMNNASKYMCRFIGSKYGFKRDLNNKYCFEAVYYSYHIFDNNFLPYEISIITEKHLNSLTFTKSSKFKTIYKYKFGKVYKYH